MKKATLEKMQIDSTLSEIKRMAAGSLIATAKRNGDRNRERALVRAVNHLRKTYDSMPFSDAYEYVKDVANEADDRELSG